jgi:hypothetical protein
VAAFKMDLLVLIVQLVVSCTHICSRVASTGTDHPNEFVDLHDCIQRQLVQLNPKLAQNICKYWMGWHAKPHSKKVLKHNSFIRSRLGHKLHARWGEGEYPFEK